MNKIVKTTVGVTTALIVILVGFFTIVPKEDRDHINPFIPKEVVYVQINEEPVPDSQRYEYTLTGYTEDGKKEEITFTSGKVLKENAYLKVVIKGSFVEEWEEIQVEELPERVLEKFI